jgi:hypothetical protein
MTMTNVYSPLLSDRPVPVIPEIGFRADDGNQTTHRRGRARATAATAAWEELLQRRIDTSGPGMPSPWELARPIQAVALALEAAGCTPSAVNEYGTRVTPGYSVCAAPDAGHVRLSFKIPARWEQVGSDQRVESVELHGRMGRALKKYTRVLEQHGWVVAGHRMEYLQAFLLVQPCTP